MYEKHDPRREATAWGFDQLKMIVEGEIPSTDLHRALLNLDAGIKPINRTTGKYSFSWDFDRPILTSIGEYVKNLKGVAYAIAMVARNEPPLQWNSEYGCLEPRPEGDRNPIRWRAKNSQQFDDDLARLYYDAKRYWDSAQEHYQGGRCGVDERTLGLAIPFEDLVNVYNAARNQPPIPSDIQARVDRVAAEMEDRSPKAIRPLPVY
jgi:hypothetical protein